MRLALLCAPFFFVFLDSLFVSSGIPALQPRRYATLGVLSLCQMLASRCLSLLYLLPPFGMGVMSCYPRSTAAPPAPCC